MMRVFAGAFDGDSVGDNEPYEAVHPCASLPVFCSLFMHAHMAVNSEHPQSGTLSMLCWVTAAVLCVSLGSDFGERAPPFFFLFLENHGYKFP